MKSFKDHFSAQSKAYASARPGYPQALFDYLATIAPATGLALDVGTGNGQAALGLASSFAQVIGIDGSQAQLDHAEAAANIEYRIGTADALPVEDASVDLITVAQALHWFPLDDFYAEAKRALKPDGVLAVWTYYLPRFGVDRIDDTVDTFYQDVIGGYWPPERVHVETGYADLPFPFTPVETPDFAMTANWDLNHLAVYISSWSAVQRYRTETGLDPIQSLMESLGPAWGPPMRERQATFAVSLLAGRC